MGQGPIDFFMYNWKKKYEETLRKAKEYYADVPGSREFLDNIFPELAESEDERIIKELITAFEAYSIESSWNGIPVRSILAWLEKQKDNEPIPDSVKFEEGYKTGYEVGKREGYWEGYWEGYKKSMESYNTSVSFHYEYPPKMPDVPTYATTSDSSNVKDLKAEQKPADETDKTE